MRKLKVALPLALLLLVVISYSALTFNVSANNDQNNNSGNFNGGCPNTRGHDSKIQLPKGSKQIINVKWTVTNDEDSGLAGYWALDHYTRSLTIYVMPNGTYAAFSNYDGAFVTPQGAVSPGSPSGGPYTTETESGFGRMAGCKFATFSASSMNSGTQLQGNLGVKNYGGTTADVLLGRYGNGQTGGTTTFDYTAYYFTGLSNYAEPIWGFTYKLSNLFNSAPAKVWINAYTGNSGDIQT